MLSSLFLCTKPKYKKKLSKRASHMEGVGVAMSDRPKLVGEDIESSSSIRKYKTYDLWLRVLGFACCLVAAVITGVNRETETVEVSLVPTLPPLSIPVTAKWYYMSSLVFFVASNAIACTYASTSLALSMITRTKPYNITLFLLILDLMMVALLFCANGAASFVGLIALRGNSHVQWRKVCGVFGHFCQRSGASLALSWVASFVFLWLVILGTLNLHKKSRWMK